MTSALISSVLGVISGILPDILKIWSRNTDGKLEVELLKLSQNYELARLEHQMRADEIANERERLLLENEQKRAEMYADLDRDLSYDDLVKEDERQYTERVKSIYENTPIVTVQWVNVFNSIIRPVLATAVMLLFLWTVIIYIRAVFALNLDSYELLSAVRDFWAIPLVETAIVGPLSFLFAQRQVRKRSRL